jgi:hypothetical protein
MVGNSQTSSCAEYGGQPRGVEGQKPQAVLSISVDDVGPDVGFGEGGQSRDGGEPGRAKVAQEKRGEPHPSGAVIGMDVELGWE